MSIVIAVGDVARSGFAGGIMLDVLLPDILMFGVSIFGVLMLGFLADRLVFRAFRGHVVIDGSVRACVNACVNLVLTGALARMPRWDRNHVPEKGLRIEVEWR